LAGILGDQWTSRYLDEDGEIRQPAEAAEPEYELVEFEWSGAADAPATTATRRTRATATATTPTRRPHNGGVTARCTYQGCVIRWAAGPDRDCGAHIDTAAIQLGDLALMAGDFAHAGDGDGDHRQDGGLSMEGQAFQHGHPLT
jgi:hypothetical protein